MTGYSPSAVAIRPDCASDQFVNLHLSDGIKIKKSTSIYVLDSTEHLVGQVEPRLFRNGNGPGYLQASPSILYLQPSV
ncbi:hypothetical protein Pdw03_3105 [Penicillium digitatum]|uniref:Uncharacterized protein n=1 Tax=Penicillium digitatum TaxID=36651 RepID=A0A7T7BHV4_PENDI|nr:hypothetical protein Pdw03_3105 [Penicillium digitatum]